MADWHRVKVSHWEKLIKALRALESLFKIMKIYKSSTSYKLVPKPTLDIADVL